MAEMKTERKSVLDYLSKNKFLIPMYQRAYVWDEDECEQLWNDINNFFQNRTNESEEEYFLGSVVMYKENGKQNIIDGQQRTTTLSILIRSLYETAKADSKIVKLTSDLASCLWDIDVLDGAIKFNEIHLKSEVATDNDNESLENLLRDSISIKENKKPSLYEKNFTFFRDKVTEFARDTPNQWYEFCTCLLHNCIVLPIECDGQENALRIFNTLNNRGVSLGVSDIFKGLIFASKSKDNRAAFAREWKELESRIQNSNYLNKENISFLFSQYQHIIRALKNEFDTVIPSTLEFWTKKDKKEKSKRKPVNFAANDDLLTKDEAFEFIKKLGDFWCNPYNHLSINAKKYFDILNIYQNKLWQMIVSMCFYKIEKNETDKNIFDRILPQVVSYCALGLIYGKAGNSGLLWGLMRANINIEKYKDKIFETSISIPKLQMPSIEHFIEFSKNAIPKQIRYILSIYALIYDENQKWEWNSDGRNYNVIKGEIEHIFPTKWQDTNYSGWDKKDAKEYLEQIGNKTLIEKKINILAGNDYFKWKKDKYKDSNFLEVKNLSSYFKDDWQKEDIEKRNKLIYERLKIFLEANI